MKYVFGNWKMYLDSTESLELANSLVYQKYSERVCSAIFPTMLSFREVQKILETSYFSVGVQNVGWTPKGAYTGSVSAYLAKQGGAKYTLVGHSERRYVFGEGDSDVTQKVEACDAVDLIPVICVGETRQDLDEGKRQYRIKKQMQAIFEGKDLSKPCILAYEPVWSISSNEGSEPCFPVDAEDVIGFIKSELKQLGVVAPVLYGGSVTPENCESYIELPSVDGLLVGSASTKKETFIQILEKISHYS